MQMLMVLNHHSPRKDMTIWTQTVKYKCIKFQHDETLSITFLYMYQMFPGKQEAWHAFPTARNFYDLTWVYQSVQTKLYRGNKWPLYLAAHNHKNILFKFMCVICLLWLFSTISFFCRGGPNLKLFDLSRGTGELAEPHWLLKVLLRVSFLLTFH